MGFAFDRPTGAGADVAELEYVSALLQTDVEEVRADGSLTAEDIALFLNSRYGVVIEEEEVSRLMLNDIDANGDGLDLVEFVTLLLIPRLRREAAKDHHREDASDGEADAARRPDLLRYVVDVLLHDTLGINVEDDDEKPIMTPDILRRMFLSLGEHELSADSELLDEMIDTLVDTNQGRVILDAEAFCKALTHDLEAYDLNNPYKLSTNLHDTVSETPAEGTLRSILPSSTRSAPSPEGHPKDDDSDGSDGETGAVAPVKRSSFLHNLEFEFTAPFVDFVADTYRSRLLVVALWASFVISFFTYYFNISKYTDEPRCTEFRYEEDWIENSTAFLCTVGWSVLRWLYVILLMSVYGLTYFGLCGMGNDAEMKNPWVPLMGAAAAALFTFLPPLLEGLDAPVDTFADVLDKILRPLSFILGGVVVVYNLVSALTLTISTTSEFWNKWKLYLTPEAVRAETFIKQAAVRKLDGMVDNSLDMHVIKDNNLVIDTHLGQCLLNYAKHSKTETERVGGFYWTWKRIWDNDILLEDGIWYSARLVSINVSQFVLAIFILLFGLSITVIATQDYSPPVTSFEDVLDNFFNTEPGTFAGDAASLVRDVSNAISDFLVQTVSTETFGCPDNIDFQCDSSPSECVQGFDDAQCLCILIDKTANNQVANMELQSALLNCAGFSQADLERTAEIYLSDAAQTSLNTIYPTESFMIFFPLLFGTIAAFLMALTIAFAVIPSMTTTTLKLRCGELDLMHDPKHKAIRIAPDQSAFLQGAMFWGLLLSCGVTALVIMSLVFFFVYQNTAAVAQRLVAWLLGVVVVVLLHWVIVRSFRFYTSKAFYRKRPLVANFVLLARECIFFALSVWSTFVRVGKLFFTTTLFMGRVDIPFLSPGVGEIERVGYKLDNQPYVFLMDILQHEAHRHPYIETFGVVCLLKLRHGPNFITRAGSAWRLLLVLVLMPWLTRYRGAARPGVRDEHVGAGPLEFRPLKESITTDGMSEEERQQLQIEELQHEVKKLKQQLVLRQATAAAQRPIKPSVVTLAQRAASRRNIGAASVPTQPSLGRGQSMGMEPRASSGGSGEEKKKKGGFYGLPFGKDDKKEDKKGFYGAPYGKDEKKEDKKKGGFYGLPFTFDL